MPALKYIIRFSVFALCLCVVAGCKKKKQFNEETAVVTVDNRMVMAESDEVIKEVNTIMMEQFLLRGRVSGASAGSSICGASIDTTQMLKGIVTIRYNGANCFGRIRNGQVRFTIVGYPTKKWKQPGCVVRLEFIGYRVKRVSDERVILLDAVEEMTNVSGGSWFDLWYMGQPSVVYSLTGSDIKVTLDDSKIAIYHLSRRMTYTYSGNITSCRVEGTGSSDGHDMLESWGQGREGLYFTAKVSSPYTWNTNCGAVAPVSGVVSIQPSGRDYELKCQYGVDNKGNSMESGCPYGWEVEWNYKRKTNSRIFAYY
jgi:hypothetical protein